MIPLKQEKRACKYQAILKAELLTATGCTEPIAIAYASALARAALGHMPERIQDYAAGTLSKMSKVLWFLPPAGFVAFQWPHS